MDDRITQIDALVAQGDEAFAAGRQQQALAIWVKALPDATHRQRSGLVARIGFVGRKSGGALLGVQQHIESLDQLPVFVGDGLAVWKKTNGFLWDNRLVSIAHKHAGLLPIPNWQHNLQTVIWALKQVRHLSGDFMELGVFKGHTTRVAAEYLDFGTWDRRWWLYDTFDGVPDDQLNPGWAEINTKVYRGTYSYEEVRDRFADFPNIEVIKGRVPEILVEHVPDRIAFLHMDLNSAVAEIAALNHLFDRITPGGVIIFDDFGWLASGDQHVAERDWMNARGLSILELPTGQGVFVKAPA